MNPDSENFEDVLRASLQREPAPTDFAARVLAKAGTSVSSRVITARPKSWFQRPFVFALAAALAAVAIVPAVLLDYEHRARQAKGLKAKQDLLTALAITRDQLQQARDKVRRNTKITQ
jgi:hypothetical protein